MNAKNELKILELKIELLKPRFSKIELLISKILLIINLIVYYKSGLIISIITGIILNWFINKTYMKTIKQEQKRLNL